MASKAYLKKQALRTAESFRLLTEERLEQRKKTDFTGIKVINGVQSPSLMELGDMLDDLGTANNG